MSAPIVFIDGESGTTGLEIAQWFNWRDYVKLLSIEPELRKDKEERARLLQEADLAILCLPDEAARESVELVGDADTIIIDASTAHRTHTDWVYGLPEVSQEQRSAISQSKRISNPGCYASGAIILLRPLISAGLIPPDYVVSINAVSGYSGGGREMIEKFKTGEYTQPYRAYGLSMQHKHLPEMQKYSGLTYPPLFSPAVGNFYRGMLVEIMFSHNSFGAEFTREFVHEVFETTYFDEKYVIVKSLEECDEITFLDPKAALRYNVIELFVFGNEENIRLIARLDNLVKGAAGVAIQNMNLALGFAEDEGAE